MERPVIFVERLLVIGGSGQDDVGGGYAAPVEGGNELLGRDGRAVGLQP